MAKQTLSEVSRKMAEQFFAAGGTLHMVAVGYGLHAGHTADRTTFHSVEQAVVTFERQIGGKALIAIDPADPHPANPLSPAEVSP